MCLIFYFEFLATEHYLPIHREAPAFIDQGTEQEILVTGIKVNFLFPLLVDVLLSFFDYLFLLIDMLECS